MTASLKQKIQEFDAVCLMTSRYDQMKPACQMITTQFGLVKGQDERLIQTFFGFCFQYYKGGARDQLDTYPFLKKMQDHHRLAFK